MSSPALAYQVAPKVNRVVDACTSTGVRMDWQGEMQATGEEMGVEEASRLCRLKCPWWSGSVRTWEAKLSSAG